MTPLGPYDRPKGTESERACFGEPDSRFAAFDHQIRVLYPAELEQLGHPVLAHRMRRIAPITDAASMAAAAPEVDLVVAVLFEARQR